MGPKKKPPGISEANAVEKSKESAPKHQKKKNFRGKKKASPPWGRDGLRPTRKGGQKVFRP